MTILVDWEIQKEVESGRLIIEPFDEKLLQPNSYDVLLGSSFSYQEIGDAFIDPFENTIRPIKTNLPWIYVHPGEFILACTKEKFSLPRDIVGQLTGKSSLARLGLMVHITAGFIDAGFSSPPASITLEIVNLAKHSIKLTAGMPIAQTVFTRTAPCKTAYNEKSTAKYNNQQDAAPSQYYRNKEL